MLAAEAATPSLISRLMRMSRCSIVTAVRNVARHDSRSTAVPAAVAMGVAPVRAEGETPSGQPAEPALSEVEGMPALLSKVR